MNHNSPSSSASPRRGHSGEMVGVVPSPVGRHGQGMHTVCIPCPCRLVTRAVCIHLNSSVHEEELLTVKCIHRTPRPPHLYFRRASGHVCDFFRHSPVGGRAGDIAYHEQDFPFSSRKSRRRSEADFPLQYPTLQSEVEETLNRIKTHKGVSGIVIVNAEGVPIRSTLDLKFTLQYSALISQLTAKARSVVRDLDPQVGWPSRPTAGLAAGGGRGQRRVLWL